MKLHRPKNLARCLGLLLVWLCFGQAVSRSAIAVGLPSAAVVRVEGPIQGSGTLFTLDGQVMLLTAWHVLRDVANGESVDVVLSNGSVYSVNTTRIQQVGNVDMAIAPVAAPKISEEPLFSDVAITAGEDARIYGFPLASKTLTIRDGMVFSNANIGIDQGYQIIYSVKTEPGMSGGPVVDADGDIVGIHGRGELAERRSFDEKKIVKTRLNNGVPIRYLFLHLTGQDATYKPAEPTTVDDLNSLIYRLWRTKADYGGDYGISLSNKLISLLKGLPDSSYKDKSLVSAHSQRADMYRSVRMYDMAIDDIDYVIQNDEPEEAYMELQKKVFVLRDMGLSGKAMLALDRLIELDPTDIEPYILRGHLHSVNQHFSFALADFDKAIELGSLDASVYSAASRMLWFKGEFAKALSYDMRAIEIDPSDPSVFIRRAFTYKSLKMYEASEADFLTALSLFSNQGQQALMAHRSLFDLYILISDHEKAASVLTLMKNEWPDSHQYLLSSASLNAAKGKHSRAISLYTKVINRQPEQVDLLHLRFLRSLSFSKVKDFKSAIRDLNEVIATGSADGIVYSQRGHAFAHKGNFLLACVDWKKSLSLGFELDLSFVEQFCVDSK